MRVKSPFGDSQTTPKTPTSGLDTATKQYVDTGDIAAKNRANHTGAQAIATITDLQNQLNYARGLCAGLLTQDPNLAVDNVILSQHANCPNVAYYWHITTTFYSSISNSSNRSQVAVQYNGGAAAYSRSSYGGIWTSWTRLDNAGVDASQIATGVLPDARLSGTYTGVSISGNAGTATKLQTARTINGVSFDGSANITVNDSTKLSVTGGTLTGFLTLNADPTSALHAASKQYVDNAVVGVSYSPATTSTNGLMSSADKTKLDNIAAYANNYVHPANHPASVITQDASNRFVTDAEKATWNAKLPLSGGTLTGLLTLSGAPTVALHAATKSYVDTAVSSIAATAISGVIPDANLSGTYTGVSITGNAGTATKLQTARTINGVSFNGTANVTIADATKLPLAGGSMTGPVSFNSEYARGDITGSVTIDFSNGQKAVATLTGNSTITFSFPGVGNYLLRLVQDATGNRTVAYAGTPKYVGSATAPAINTTANSETILSLYWTGTSVYIGGSKVNA